MMSCRLIIIGIVAFYCLTQTVIHAKEGHCVWYGECYESQNGYQNKNCRYEGPARVLDSEGQKILEKHCPHLMQDAGTEVKTCCDIKQLKTLDRNTAMVAALFKRCPSCLNNLMKIFCEYTCSPKQSTFINVTEVVEAEPKSYINKIEVYVTKKYLNGAYKSCSKVYVPSMGKLALDLICGDLDTSRCSPMKWFHFMGDAANIPYVPFQITYIPTDVAIKGYEPIDPYVTPCSHPLNPKTPACGCVDSEESCPVPPALSSPPQPFTLNGYDGYAVIMTVIFVSGSTLFFHLIYSFSDIKRIDVISCHNSPKEKSTIIERLGAKIDTFLHQFFSWWGTACAQRPWVVLFFGFLFIVSLGHGINYMHLTTDPVELWASPSSRARIEREYFDSHFEPFYRNEQIIISSIGLQDIVHNTPDGLITFGPVFHQDFLLKVRELQESIKDLVTDNNHTLADVCFAPLTNDFTGPTQIDQCAIQSLWGYWQNEIETFNKTSGNLDYEVNYLDHFKKCTQNPYNQDCLAPYGGPVEPAIAVGGFLKPGQSLHDSSYEKATAIVLTFLVNNYHNKTKLQPAMEWEAKFIAFMKDWVKTKKPDYMDVAFTSERSIEDELNRQSQSDIPTILMSYIIMFAYITVSLGQMRSCGRLLIDSKITLALSGVLVVLSSVICSVGLFGFIGVSATHLIIEVIPFLVLAVGVDNILILVQTHQREGRRPNELIPDHIGRILGMVGPSMLLTNVSETCCVFLCGLSDMPAVRAFALYAGTALLINFLLQITCFVSLLALDTIRQTNDRFDIFCWIRGSKEDNDEEDVDGTLYKTFKVAYVPLLLEKWMRAGVMTIFFGWFCTSIAVLPYIEIGLDQKLSMLNDSFVLKYFQFFNDYLSIGPPMYFVVKGGLNYSDFDQQNLVCGGRSCNSDSMSSQIFVAAKQSNRTYIAKPASSWIDDYFDWSQSPECCKYFPGNNSFCPHTDYSCDPCKIKANEFGRLNVADFEKYFSFFLQDNPDRDCGKAGHAAYGRGVNYLMDPNSHSLQVGASYFMAYHSILKSSADYYESMRAARVISANITDMINTNLRNHNVNETVEIFPYSVFYVFYEQYLTMWPDTLQSIIISLLAISIATFLLMGLDIMSSLIVLITITMIVVNIGGLMYWWHITLNAVSLVNLVMAVGISVEFCSYLVHSFSVSVEDTRIDRAADAVTNVGSSVFSAITLTKIGGIIVLGCAKSRIFTVFHFRIYLGIVLFGTAHGLIFLPVLLSYIGSPMNREKLANHKRTIRGNPDNVQRNSLNNGVNKNHLYPTSDTMTPTFRVLDCENLIYDTKFMDTTRYREQ